jgi:CheY-like chemotaxis protein
MLNRTPVPPRLPNGCRPSSPSVLPTSKRDLADRVTELESLCAEVYVAAVELGISHALLNRLWTVAAHGQSPHAYAIELTPRAEPKPEGGPLPDVRLIDRPELRERHPTASMPPLKPLTTRRTVMVVDDDPMILKVLLRILRQENVDIIAAVDGPDALRKVDECHEAADVLVTDYAMPGMNGRELAAEMRRRWPGIRVLYQTGFSDLLFEERIELEEGSAFLEKPYTARGLREAVRFILFGAMNPSEEDRT